MKRFVAFTASREGRILQIVVGIALITAGLLSAELLARAVLIAPGSLLLAAGIFDICLLAPLVGYSMRGSKVRSRKRRYR
jgi:hypothetical protein